MEMTIFTLKKYFLATVFVLELVFIRTQLTNLCGDNVFLCGDNQPMLLVRE